MGEKKKRKTGNFILFKPNGDVSRVTLYTLCCKDHTEAVNPTANLDFEGGQAGASNTHPQLCSSLQNDGFVCIKGRPCKIVEMTTKTGKHNVVKVHLVGLEVFTGKKYEDLWPSTYNIDVPEIKRQELQVVSVDDDGFLSLMMDSGELRDDLKVIPEVLKMSVDEVRQKFDDTEDNGRDECLMAEILTAMGEECVTKLRTTKAA